MPKAERAKRGKRALWALWALLVHWTRRAKAKWVALYKKISSFYARVCLVPAPLAKEA